MDCALISSSFKHTDAKRRRGVMTDIAGVSQRAASDGKHPAQCAQTANEQERKWHADEDGRPVRNDWYAIGIGAPDGGREGKSVVSSEGE